MAELNFDWTDGSYKSGDYTIEVSSETSKILPLFIKKTFRDTFGLPFFHFSIKHNDKTYKFDYNSRGVSTLYHIDYVEVFFSRLAKNNPLLIGVNNPVNYKYYKISESRKGHGVNVLRKNNKLNYDQLIDVLIEENDKINNTITFRIDKKDTYNNVTVVTTAIDGFSKHVHSPKDKFASNQSIVLNEKLKIQVRGSFETVHDIQIESISVYYRQSGVHSNVPLLFELAKDGNKYYFTRRIRHENTWTQTTLESEDKLVRRLEKIETKLLYSVLVLLHKQVSYKKDSVEYSKTTKNVELKPYETINVSLKSCSTLSGTNYCFYEHDLSKYNDKRDNLNYGFGKGNFQIILANIFDVEIEIYDNLDYEMGNIFYHRNNTKLSVCFYEGNKNIDNLPLMMHYGDKWYKPGSRDDYFNNWITVPTLDGITDPCNHSGSLVQELNVVNKMLNQVDLSSNVFEKDACEYGIPRPFYLDRSFNVNMISMNCGPFSSDDFYSICTHTPINGYTFESTTYGKNGSRVRKNEILHTSATSAFAYYFKNDTNKEYPLLVEYKLSNGKYKYYLLQSDRCELDEYNPKISLGQDKIDDSSIKTILDHQSFIFHNVIQIQLDNQSKYLCCDELKDTKHVSFTNNSTISHRYCEFKTNKDYPRDKVPFIDVSCENFTGTYGYLGYIHSLSNLLLKTGKIEKPYRDSSEIQIRAFKLNNTSIKLNDSEFNVNNVVKAKDIYVYFYGGDPRPLLLCYGGQAYIPKDKDKYFSDWVQVPDVQKCVCDNGESATKLLDGLTKVVGFLNTVDLSKHPSSTGTGNGKCEAISPGTPGTACSGKNGQSKCEYVVHTYNGKQVKIKVCCEPVKRSESAGNGQCNYMKLTHTPAGLDGKGGGGNGFRLGDVIHSKDTNKLDYTKGATISQTNKYQPLVRVTAYFYNADTKYQDPLLVELEFSNGVGASSGNNKEYYKLQPSDGGRLMWQKDTGASSAVGGNGDKLAKYLDKIRYGIKKVLKIELQHNTSRQYKAYWSSQPGQTSGFTPLNGVGSTGNKQITVQECTTGKCTALNSYKCFQHKITEGLGEENLNKIGGIALTLPSKNGAPEKPIEIPLFNGGEKCQNGDKPMNQLFYNSCMGDVYVFFYHGTGGGGVKPSTVDTVPLMLWYNKQYYKPENRENYFSKWVCVKELGGASDKPCGSDNGASLVPELDKVNKSLNVIDLSDKDTGKGKDKSYGLPPSTSGGKDLDSSVGNERVKVVTQQGPSKPTPGVYTKVVHRTTNGFEIGEIHYGSKEIVASGIQVPNGGKEICVKKDGVGSGNGGNHNHKSKVAGSGWNTVVAYYSQTDATKKLPQLIVILKTDSEVKGGTDVTGARDTQYGYYILTTDKSGRGYEYKWVDVKDGSVTLNDATDFTLLNSVVILVDKQKKGDGNGYGESEISTAIRSAIQQNDSIKSPGQSDDINRLTGREIVLKDEKNGSASCLDGTGFKLITHDITKLVDPEPKIKGAEDVRIISGLRFLIPTREQDKYKQLTLKENGEKPGSGGKELIMYHQKSHEKINVFFYDKDPRPLLMCYDSKAYKAKSIDDYDEQTWVKENNVTDCKCDRKSGGSEQILKKLVEVSNFLNPLNIKYVPKGCGKCRLYPIHRFNGKLILVKVEIEESDNLFCYHRYTHTHLGTGSSGTGFRLGNIMYKGECIKLNGGTSSTSNGQCITSVLNGEQPKTYKSADKVVVFYYKHDTKHENPLMVVLCGSEENRCKPYYTLKEKGKTEYEKKESEIDLSNNETLGDELDKVLFRNNKMLQIILSERPKPIKLCPEDYKKNCNGHNCFRGNNCDKQDEILKQLQCKLIEELKNDNKPKPECVVLSPGISVCYQAQLYTNDGSEVSNGGPGNGKTNIKVTEVTCNLKNGYKCFKHDLVNTKGIEEVGSLKLYLRSDNKGVGHTEIKLYNDSYVELTQKLHSINYTTCKGDIYVYFYDDAKIGCIRQSDKQFTKVPLMFYFNGSFYKPENGYSYPNKWVLVSELKGVSHPCEPGNDKKINKSLQTINQIPDHLNETEEKLSESGDNESESLHSNEIQNSESYNMLPAGLLSRKNLNISDGISNIQGDQAEVDVSLEIPKDSIESDTDVESGESKKEVQHTVLSSTGEAEDSGDSNLSYLGYSIGGTFSSLLIVGVSILLVYKHLLKFKMRNMMPRFY